MAEPDNVTKDKDKNDQDYANPHTQPHPPPPQPRPHRRSLKRGILTFITVLFLIAAIAALIVWLIYKPQKPSFTVTGAAVYALNITMPPFLATSMQFTVLTRNPNTRVALYYDRLSATVYYRDEAITQQVQLPPLYHERHSTVMMMVLAGGGLVPVSAEVARGLKADTEEEYGVMRLRLVVMGRVRYKAGRIKTGHYGVYVRCDMLLGFKKGFVGQAQAPPLLCNPQCEVDA
ncbi:hypothetical protein Dimus_006710 [Dionaea muscipula]